MFRQKERVIKQEIEDAMIKVLVEEKLLCSGVLKTTSVLSYEKKEAHSGLKYT